MKTPNFKPGFTLMEMLISLTIFSVVVAIAVGAFVTVLKGQRNALATQAVQDNASVVIESMAREIRTGFGFSVSGGSGSLSGDPSGSSAGTQLNFTNSKGEAVSYRLNNNKIERKVGAGSFTQISSVKIKVSNLRFVLQGAGSSDGKQPMVTIISRFENVGVRPEELVVINISTSLTQRKLDG